MTRSRGQKHAPQDLETTAHGLARRLPALLVEAARTAHTVTHGIHGRRQAGAGETFWQFRHFEATDTAAQIDWRRSASSDYLFIREREWEAAHTVWIWPDISRSMHFRSHLAQHTKAERALILVFALSELLIQGGERVGLLGAMPPTANRNGVHKIAVAIAKQQAANATTSLPPRAKLSRFSSCLLFSDFLEPIETLRETMNAIAAQGGTGHLVQVLDPAEETLPYNGRVEFIASEGDTTVVAERVGDLRSAYQKRLAAHRDELAALARRLEWPLLVHHTDRPPEETLLALHARLSGTAGDYRAKGISATSGGQTSSTGGGRT